MAVFPMIKGVPSDSVVKSKVLENKTVNQGSGVETTITGVGFKPDLVIMDANNGDSFVECLIPKYNVMVETYAESASSIGGGRLSSAGYLKEVNSDGFVFKNKGTSISSLTKVYCYKLF